MLSSAVTVRRWAGVPVKSVAAVRPETDVESQSELPASWQLQILSLAGLRLPACSGKETKHARFMNPDAVFFLKKRMQLSYR